MAIQVLTPMAQRISPHQPAAPRWSTLSGLHNFVPTMTTTQARLGWRARTRSWPALEVGEGSPHNYRHWDRVRSAVKWWTGLGTNRMIIAQHIPKQYHLKQLQKNTQIKTEQIHWILKYTKNCKGTWRSYVSNNPGSNAHACNHLFPEDDAGIN